MGRDCRGAESHQMRVQMPLEANHVRRGLSEEVNWTPELNQSLIDYKSRRADRRDIAAAMNVSVHSVSKQWHHLKNKILVPEEVLKIWRPPQHRLYIPWTHRQDVYILELWDSGLSNEQIWQITDFKDRGRNETR